MDSTALAISFLESLHPRLHLLLYLLAFWLLYRTRILHAIVGAADVVLGRRLSKGLTLVSARYAEVVGDWARAGQLHEELCNPHRAIECFELAEDYERCAEICLALGRNDYAAEWLELAGDPRRAGDLFDEAFLFDKAAGAYLNAGAHLRAASAFVRSGAYARAAELYSAHGAFELAGEAFENAEQFEQAAECFEKTLHEAGDLQSLTTTTAERESAARASLRAAECYKRAGKPARALDVLAKGQHHELAANVAAGTIGRQHGSTKTAATGKKQRPCTRSRASRSRRSASRPSTTWKWDAPGPAPSVCDEPATRSARPKCFKAWARSSVPRNA